MIPTSARRRRLLLNLLPRPLLILRVQLDLALVHCPSINRNNPEGETNKQTSNMCTSEKGKQTSRGGTCRGADAGGGVELCNMWSLICNASEYAEELQRCIGKAQSLICRVILSHHPPSKRVLLIIGDSYGMGWG